MLYNTSIPLPLAVWLLHDEYDYQPVDNKKYLSATQLLQPTRSIVLARRMNKGTKLDLDSLIAPRLGNAIHESIEAAWKNRTLRIEALKTLGYPSKIYENLDVHIEERNYRDIGGYTIGGKFDMVINGTLYDFKSTSVSTWLNKDKEDSYQKQGSIYRWLNPHLITSDCVSICFIFTDWSQKEAGFKEDYPKSRIQQKDISLLSMGSTEMFIRRKLQEINANADLDQDEMIPCTDKELWRTPSTVKYYASGDINKKATKVFSTIQEAIMYKSKNGNKGTIITVPGEPRRCRYCIAASICKQKADMCGE